LAGVAGVLVGFASIQLTAVATEAAMKTKPQLLPLLTARFIADGPGKAFIDAGCEGRRFQICRVHIGEPDSGGAILSGTTPANGTYLLAAPDERRRMGNEDVAFAAAVFASYPAWQSAMMLRNTVRQLLWIDYDGLNQGCFKRPDCWQSLPAGVRNDLRASPSGRNAWPVTAMNALLYVVTIGALLAIVLLYKGVTRAAPTEAPMLRTWMLVGAAGMLASAFFGGAMVEPQYRYQGRLVWLIPLLAGVIILLLRAKKHKLIEEKEPDPRRSANLPSSLR